MLTNGKKSAPTVVQIGFTVPGHDSGSQKADMREGLHYDDCRKVGCLEGWEVSIILIFRINRERNLMDA